MLESHSVDGYFDHTVGKAYINHYPPEILKGIDFANSVSVEIGCGVGNDALYFIQQLGMNPFNMFFVDPDVQGIVETIEKIEKEVFRVSHPDSPINQRLEKYTLSDFEDLSEEVAHFRNDFQKFVLSHFHYESILYCTLPAGIADLVYANNVLHCMGYPSREEEMAAHVFKRTQGHCDEEWSKLATQSPFEKVRKAIEMAYALLKPGGIFIGRCLTPDVYPWRLDLMEETGEDLERIEFIRRTIAEMEKGRIVGIYPAKFETFGYASGFSAICTLMKEESWKPLQDFYFRCER